MEMEEKYLYGEKIDLIPLIVNNLIDLEDRVVMIEFPGCEHCDRSDIRVSVLERSFMEGLISSIALDNIAKDVVGYAWDRKEETDSYISVNVRPQDVPCIEIQCLYDTHEYAIPGLYINLMQLDISEGTFDKYNSKEEAINDYANLVSMAELWQIEDDLDYLYDTVIIKRDRNYYE